MMKSMKYLVTLISLTMGVTACSTVPKHVAINGDMSHHIKKLKPRAAVFLNDEGVILPTDAKGMTLPPCSIGPHGKHKQCRGFGESGTILEIKTLTLIKSKGSNCWTFYNGLTGAAYQICW